MVKNVAQFTVKGSTGDRTVTVREAQIGPERGRFYLSCSCAGGRFAWSPAGYHACKHAKEVIEACQLQLTNGHFDTIPTPIRPMSRTDGQMALFA